ncbi:MAG TPA: hypothetical protein VHK90_09250 [Thermoanaerobaculia bacterium]|nr:hypothetical protein [Thermoanaerobaculia bacterium]
MSYLVRISALVLALFAACQALGFDFSGKEIFIPVVSRVPGANNTQWRTDLTLTNRSEDFPTQVSMIYDPTGPGEAIQRKVDLDPLMTVTLLDVVLSEFGAHESYGTLWLGSSDARAPIAAHARLYNAGNAAGQFGQMVQGLPLEQLPRTVWLHGLIGFLGNRANVGIANPNNTPAHYSITWYDKHGESHGSSGMHTVQPWEVVLINDIFGYLGLATDEGLTIRLRSDLPIYAYGSIVRNDTGDAYTILGNGTR